MTNESVEKMKSALMNPAYMTTYYALCRMVEVLGGDVVKEALDYIVAFPEDDSVANYRTWAEFEAQND